MPEKDPCKDNRKKVASSKNALQKSQRNLKNAIDSLDQAGKAYAAATFTAGAADGILIGAVVGEVLSLGGATPVTVPLIIAALGSSGVLAATKEAHENAQNRYFDAKDDALDAETDLAVAENELKHCMKANADEDGDGIPAKDDPDDDMPPGDEDELPLGSKDYEDDDEDDDMPLGDADYKDIKSTGGNRYYADPIEIDLDE